MWYEWIFSGIGTTLLTGIGGVIIGGIGGYQLGINSRGKQWQKAGLEAKQRQELEVNEKDIDRNNRVKSYIRQKQKAGDKSDQIQVGRVTNGK